MRNVDRFLQWTCAAAALWLTVTTARAEPPPAMPLTLQLEPNGTAVPALDVPVGFPGESTVHIQAPTSTWVNVETLEFTVTCPKDAPTNTQVLVFLKDWDYYWYQNLHAGALRPGSSTRIRVRMAPTASGWEPRGHAATWNLRALIHPVQVGFRLFAKGDTPFSGTLRVDQARALLQAGKPEPPDIRKVRANSNRVGRFQVFELTFELPDRYPDPFDADQVQVSAEFTGPGGMRTRVDGYYGQDHYRLVDETGEHIIPQGPPYWRVRFAPRATGTYRYVLYARDAHGQDSWGPATFESVPSPNPGFVRVSAADPRFFEFDNGTAYFPIGHNTRSPFDTRMDQQFPWADRRKEGSAAYLRYFDAMGQHGENIAEVWTSAWSLGLEWTPRQSGYHGVGWFNLIHAWEMDRVVQRAEHNGIYLNVVIHNHGKFTTVLDHEWEYNPLNTANGGFLSSPLQFFSDPRAHRSFLKLMRYMIARWGASTSVFAWELWSELDLVGDREGYYNHHRTPAVVEWHRTMGRAVKDMDINKHLVSAHVSGDYQRQNSDLISLPEMDLCPVDAYHGSGDPIQIVRLMRATAAHNNPFGKPVLITEFGGSHMGADVAHLEDALHAGLWASPCVAVAGAPMLWWWQLVEEENFYPKYAALSRFMQGEDRRDPHMVHVSATVTGGGEAGEGLAVECMANGQRGCGWLYQATLFRRLNPLGEPAIRDVSMALPAMQDGHYEVEFWNTISGTVDTTVACEAGSGTLTIPVPPFARDIAFKVRPAE